MHSFLIFLKRIVTSLSVQINAKSSKFSSFFNFQFIHPLKLSKMNIFYSCDFIYSLFIKYKYGTTKYKGGSP